MHLLLNNRKWQSWETYENDQMEYWEHTLCLKDLIKAIHVSAYYYPVALIRYLKTTDSFSSIYKDARKSVDN